MDFFEIILILGNFIGFVDGSTIQVKDDTGKAVTVKLACITVPETNGTASLKKILAPNTPLVVKTTEPV